MRRIIVLIYLLFLPLPAIAADSEEATVQRFMQILERNPREGTSLDKVYAYYFSSGKLDELITRIETEASRNSYDAGKRVLLGLFYEKSGKESKAIENYRDATELTPNDFYANYYLGRLLLKQNLASDAVGPLQRAIEFSSPQLSDVIDAAILQGKTYAIIEDYENFDRLLDKVSKTLPGDDTVLLSLIETLDSEKRYTQAIERYTKVLDQIPHDAIQHFSFMLARGNASSKAGRYVEAAVDYEYILDRLQQDHLLVDKVYSSIENMYTKRKDHDALVDFYKTRLISTPNDIALVKRYADSLFGSGRFDEAEDVLSQTLQRSPSDTVLRTQLIRISAAKKDFDNVDRQFEIIKETAPYDMDRIILHGEIALSDTRFTEPQRKDRAREIWSEITRHDPNDTASIVLLSHLFDAAGMPEDAEQMLKIVSAENDDTVVDLGKLIRLYNKPGNENSTVSFYIRSFLSQPEIATQRELLDQMFGDEDDITLREAGMLRETVKQLKLKHARQSVIERLEIRLDVSENSVKYLLRKSKGLVAQGNRTEAVETLKQIASIIPLETEIIMQYASLLEIVGMKKEALIRQSIAFRLDPKLFFQNSDRYVREYERENAIDLLFETFLDMNDAIHLEKAERISEICVTIMGKNGQKEAASTFFDKLWKKTFPNEEQKLRHHIGLIKGGIWSSHHELYTYYHEIVLKLISPCVGTEIENRNESLYNPHWIVAWGADQCRSISYGLSATIPENEIDTFSKELDGVLKQYENMELSQQNWARYSYAVVMKALILLKTGEHENSLAMLKNLEKNEHTLVPLTYCGAVLGQEFAAIPEKSCKYYATQCFQRYRNINRHSYGEVYLGLQLSHLQTEQVIP